LKYEVPTDDPRPVLDQIRTTATSLDADGGTAIYSSLRSGYDVLTEQINADPDRFTSIVLMTDGENTGSEDILQFQLFHQNLPQNLKGIPIFPVLFGESATAEMDRLAKMSGGKVFDARSRSLSAAFKEIRGYQ
jgi:Ca-activated chloride channel family protein